jgi:hypothetical protein
VTSTAATHWRELARKTGNGVEAALLWDRSVNRVKVTVSDGKLCRHIDFELAGADALTAFEHTFAHAAEGLSGTDEFWNVSSSLLRNRHAGGLSS